MFYVGHPYHISIFGSIRFIDEFFGRKLKVSTLPIVEVGK